MAVLDVRLSYMLVGWIMQRFAISTVMFGLALWHLAVAFIMAKLIDKLSIAEPTIRWAAAAAAKTAPLLSPSSVSTRASSASTGAARFLDGFRRGYNAYRELPPRSRWMMLAYIAVYLTVLSPSGLLTAWLTAEGVDTTTLAAFRSASQLVGCAATVAIPSVIGALGPLKCALFSLSLQLVCVTTAVISVVGIVPGIGSSGSSGGGGAGDGVGTGPLMVAITASRLGLWGFDLSERQIVQEDAVKSLPATEKTVLFNWEKALCNAAYLVMVALSLAFDAPADFWVLVVVSAAAITAAFLMALVANNVL